jgi:hypothetical protein
MKHVSLVLALALAAGCYGGVKNGATPGKGSLATANVNVATHLPCDVQQVLSENCWSCHGTTPSKGVPASLVTYENLTATENNSGKTFAELAIDRMTDPKSPMPPDGPLDASQVGILKAWVAAGMNEGSCGDASGTTQPDPYDTPTVCTSGKTWRGGNIESPDMHPGGACIDCHRREGPRFTIAGTLYPSAHEPDDCNGVTKTGDTIVITGADGKELRIPVTSVAGNFSSRAAVAMPYHAKVVDSEGNVRAMSHEQTSGDCNGCHTVDGTKDAPGRIMRP